MSFQLRDFWEKTNIPTKDIPQANRLDKIIELTCGELNWPCSSNDIAVYIGYEPRQGAYYADAAELLGLLWKNRNKWELTTRGIILRSMIKGDRQSLLREYAIEIPIVCIVLRLVESSDSAGISVVELVESMMSYSDLDVSTLKRRIDCILSWLQQLDLIARIASKAQNYVHHSLTSQMRLTS